MRVIFRVDASVAIGSGHLMRCLTLADALRPFARILFVCRHLLPNLEKLLRDREYALHLLPMANGIEFADDLPHSRWLGVTQQQDAQDTINAIATFGGGDWLVVDHYSLDCRFEQQLRKHVKKIMVIDDLADRVHDCDVLVDQNPYADMQTRYLDKVPDHCLCLLGTSFCFLRNEFILQRNYIAPRSGRVNSILVYFGGIDSQNCTQKAVEAVLDVASSDIATGKLRVDVVVGEGHPAIAKLHVLCERKGMTLHVQTPQMARLMARADLAVGAGGISTFERLYLRLPALLTPIADNQREPLRFMQSLGYFKLYENSQQLKYLLRKALATNNASPPDCVDNGIPVLTQVLRKSLIDLRQPTSLDIRRTFHWLQNETLRREFQMASRPEPAQHFNYWRKLRDDNTQRVYAIYYEGRHVGNCGLKNIDVTNAESELWIYLGDEAERGKGVAKAAIKELQHTARLELKCKRMYLHVAKDNLPAVHLYVATGFVPSRTPLTHPWENRDGDVQKMECIL